MHTIEIPVPEAQYKFIRRNSSFNIIYPYEHPICSVVRIDTVVKAVGFNNDDYISLFKDQSSIKNINPIESKFLELEYIRDCKVFSVTRNEWDNNYGAGSAREFLSLIKSTTPDSYVKILKLRAPRYSLKELNYKYAQ